MIINQQINHENTPIHIYSCGIDFQLSPFLKELITQVNYIYGSKTLLDKIALENTKAQKIAITAKAKEQAKEILELAKENTILILCSGDCLYNGFGGTLQKTLEETNSHIPYTCYPNITAFQALFARLGLAWEKASLFTAHFSEYLPLRKIITAKMPVIYGGSKFPAHKIAQEILFFAPQEAQRKAFIADNLGTEKEYIFHGTITEIQQKEVSPTSILVLLPMEKDYVDTLYFQQKEALTLGLWEEVFEKENNLITQSDTRAIILSRLRLPKYGIMWDLGAGSGAIGLEVAGLTEMEVHGVEQHKHRETIIKNNQKNLGIMNYTIHHGKILETIPHLPKAHRIFIGGGGKELQEILDNCISNMHDNALLLVSAVTLENYHALYAYQNPQLQKIDLLQIAISSENNIAKIYHHFKQTNTIYLFIFKKV